ncbi:MAG: 23S rRNA (adenine(2503)-C(2))-methyltransferase RlmN [Deltaproteobacteria bacterium]|nr:23S rRNA (adenine(2503)-C(2))-methyltransferase RlmN [Deltaproteobacteria bacterium]
MTPVASTPRAPALADLDRAGLAGWLAAETGVARATCERTATKALRLAFGSGEAPPWTAETLTAANIGRWAQDALLALDPRPSLVLHERAPSSDGTIRLLFRTHDGMLIESVVIPAEDGRRSARTTLCISTQVGCARACSFCETGRLGLARQLSAGEIFDQVRLAIALCLEERPRDRRARDLRGDSPEARQSDAGSPSAFAERPISNVVFMGMGEPLDNLREVLRALALLTEPVALAFPPSRITVSTVGVTDKIAAFYAGTNVDLAVSLHATDDARRSAIMPVNRKHDLETLRTTLLATVPKNRKIMFQYTLFDRWNDAPEDADALAEFVRPFRCRVNVIPANPGPDPALVAPSHERFDAFVARLSSHGVTTLVRRPRGRDVGGACGQLAGARRLTLLEERPSCG